MDTDIVDPKVFMARCERLAKTAGLEMSTLARKIFNDTRAFERVRKGRVTYQTLEKAELELELLEQEAAARQGGGPAA